jgi:hypothetical protein
MSNLELKRRREKEEMEEVEVRWRRRRSWRSAANVKLYSTCEHLQTTK